MAVTRGGTGFVTAATSSAVGVRPLCGHPPLVGAPPRPGACGRPSLVTGRVPLRDWPRRWHPTATAAVPPPPPGRGVTPSGVPPPSTSRAAARLPATLPSPSPLPSPLPPPYVPPPHSGAHPPPTGRRGGAGSTYFEGWFLRLVSPTPPHSSVGLVFAIVASKGVYTDGSVQVLLPAGDVVFEAFPPLDRGGSFYAARDALGVAHWPHEAGAYVSTGAEGYDADRSGGGGGGGECDSTGGGRERRSSRDRHGYEFSAAGSRGRLVGGGNGRENGGSGDGGGNGAAWDVTFTDLVGYGGRWGAPPRSTGTWASHWRGLDPGYQILITSGRAAGWVAPGRSGCVDGDGADDTGRIDVTGWWVYAEKNWGSAFPRRWWWLTAPFPWGSVTAVGATRRLGPAEEVVGLISVTAGGVLYEFANWSATRLTWSVGWARGWTATATAYTGHTVVVSGVTMVGTAAEQAGVAVAGPDAGGGMGVPIRDALSGRVRVEVRAPPSAGGGVLVAGVCGGGGMLEVGGDWADAVARDDDEVWAVTVSGLPAVVRGVVNGLAPGGAPTDA
ncbi:hypothetical protein MMPV_008888 [Pyropia vietnamensis]